ncbi:MAG: hypothetical protein SP1CHLAM54_11330 [Chlamydiia bacterium]|nr:hypothetical protein [Chlamydiia bacterium]MCH9616036.1 hypothetical protein [Chlamydiia bacterium]MCH9629059.1 hypothetical protein [Chlamydiia bacterium]
MIKFYTFLLLCSFASVYGLAPQVIFLNGPACSGKTTVAKNLQETLEAPHLYMSFDQVVEMVPESMKHWYEDPGFEGFSSVVSVDEDGHPLAQFQMGSYALSIRHTFMEMCRVAAEKGHNLLIEDVFFSKDDAKKWEEALSGFNVLWVQLHAPLAVLEQREIERGSWPGCARYQFYEAFHKPSYDMTIDTSEFTLEEVVTQLDAFYTSLSSKGIENRKDCL